MRRPPRCPLFPYTTLFRSAQQIAFRDRLVEGVKTIPGVTAAAFINDFPLGGGQYSDGMFVEMTRPDEFTSWEDRKSTRLNSSHLGISYAVFCLKKKKGSHARARDEDAESNAEAGQVALTATPAATSGRADTDADAESIRSARPERRGLRASGVV